MILKEYKTKSGEIILYNGNLNTQKIDRLAEGYGDIWHSSFEQGYKNAFPDIVFQTSVLFWYINDFENLDECVSWRINPNHFAIRKTAWEILGGFDTAFENIQMQALDFGFSALRFQGAIPLYVKGLFETNDKEMVAVSARDRYVFFVRNFKIDHAFFMLYRKGLWKYGEWMAFLDAKKNFSKRVHLPLMPPRQLKEIDGKPNISYIIPTMFRQDYTLQLLKDLAQQNYLPKEVFVVDATPQQERDDLIYQSQDFPFELSVIWQQSKGSCRARNEAIAQCSGDYIVFGDDDIRIPPDFIANHIRLIQTYQARACNGLDVTAANPSQNLDDLRKKLESIDNKRWFVGSTQMFSNANSCVKKEYVDQLVGNDINYDGGYGEDGDFGISLLKMGVPVLYNPFSPNLHLKPVSGGYRFWGSQARIMGKKRKTQPWELDTPVKWVRPVPSPTLIYQFYKHYTPRQVSEFRHRYIVTFLLDGSKFGFFYRLLRLPYKQLQFSKAVFYAKKLLELGVRTK